MLPRVARVAFSISVVSISVAVALCVTQARAQGLPPADSQAPHTAPRISSSEYSPITLREKGALYTDRTFSIRTLLGTSYAAGLAQWSKSPREWGSGISGYGRRYAAAFGAGFIRHTTEFGVGALLHEDPRFEPSIHDGFAARSAEALHNTVFVRTDDGGHRLAWSRAAASLATGFAVNSWEPRRLHSTHHALMLSLAGIASYGTGNLMREFTPDVKRFLLHELRLDDRM